MVKRQGSTKTASEINDICVALKILSEKDNLPMFLATRIMLSQTPIYNPHPVDSESAEVNKR